MNKRISFARGWLLIIEVAAGWLPLVMGCLGRAWDLVSFCVLGTLDSVVMEAPLIFEEAPVLLQYCDVSEVTPQGLYAACRGGGAKIQM